MQKILFFLSSLACLIAIFFTADRHFFKINDGFCIHHIYSDFPEDAEWVLEKNSLLTRKELSHILSQPFFYLAKGHQSFVFESGDHEYVIKLYRFPSHLRLFPKLGHPLSYQYSKKRKDISKYNIQKLHETISSYHLAYEKMAEESGLLLIHQAKTASLDMRATLVDQMKHTYNVDLNKTLFVLQKKGVLLLDALQKAISLHHATQGKKIVDDLLSFIATRCKKGIKDNDPVLAKNYGWKEEHVLQVDIGRLKIDPSLQDAARQKEEIILIVEPLKGWLFNHDAELYHYLQKRLLEL